MQATLGHRDRYARLARPPTGIGATLRALGAAFATLIGLHAH
jgi:hypothetical protein